MPVNIKMENYATSAEDVLWECGLFQKEIA